MKIYIAGPMTGLPDSNYPAFHAAAAAWRAAGWQVENPAEHFGGDPNRKYVEYVEVDVEMLKTCDAIAMLPGWDAGHSGAIWERAIAKQILGLRVFDATRPIPPVGELDGGGQILVADYDEYRAFQAWRNSEKRMTVAAAFDRDFTPKEVLNILTALNMRNDGEFEAVHHAMSDTLDGRRFPEAEPPGERMAAPVVKFLEEVIPLPQDLFENSYGKGK